MKLLKKNLSLFNSNLYRQYFKKILLYFSIPCIVFFIFAGYIYSYHYNYTIMSSSQNSFNYIEQYLNNALSETKNKYMVISTDKNVRNCLFLDKNNFYSSQNKQFTESVNNLLTYCVDTSNVISSVYLYSINNEYIYCNDNTYNVSANYADTFIDMNWYKKYLENPAYQILIGGYSKIYKRNMLTVIYELQYYNSLSGLLVFNISDTTINEFLSNHNEDFATNILIKADNGELIFSTFKDNYDYEFYDSDTSEIKKKDNNVYYTKKLDFSKVNLLVMTSFPNTSSFIPTNLILPALLFILLLPAFISLFLANNFYEAIAKIIFYIQEIESDNTNIENELDFIYSRLQNVIRLSHNFEYSIAKNITETQQSQLISLQTQLNPHFLFNTLNALTLMNSTNAKKENFELLIRNLSNLLSYTLNTTKNIVTIKDDLDYLNYYIEIEELKYDSKLNIIFDIRPELYDELVPKFTFQPIIENSLKHGFKYNFFPGHKIYIKVKIINNQLQILITDNGAGISEEEVNKINSMIIKGIFPQNKNIGILNINKRIQLLFGNEYGCHIYSKKNIGTSTIITIPTKLH